MKTITEYQPLMFSRMAEHAAERSRLRLRIRRDLLASGGYSVLGLGLWLDTGFGLWQWPFWLMFLPIFVAAELVGWLWRAK